MPLPHASASDGRVTLRRRTESCHASGPNCVAVSLSPNKRRRLRSNGPGFQFRAGQTLDLTLIDPPEADAEGNTRRFSIASAPNDGELVIATRLRNSAFKRMLASPRLPRPL